MSARSWTDWGPLAERYRATRSRRILALDGGGIRGLLTLQILDRLEQELRHRQNAGPGFRLCDFFDLIGGTSTGAIIAAGLARGMSTTELITFYREFGREAFTKRALIARWKSLYANGPLQRKLQDTFGRETTLEPQHLRSLLLVVTRNATTDSAWPISSNPWAKYNDRARPDCNLRLPLWQIVRASTAAPVDSSRSRRPGCEGFDQDVCVCRWGHDGVQQPGVSHVSHGDGAGLPARLGEGRRRATHRLGRHGISADVGPDR